MYEQAQEQDVPLGRHLGHDQEPEVDAYAGAHHNRQVGYVGHNAYSEDEDQQPHRVLYCFV